jgi:putative ABC transport system permease protein
MSHDLHHALRRLARSPGFVALAALTLSLGIGVNAALFSVLDALLLRPLPYADFDRVVLVAGPPQAFVRFTLSGFELWPTDLGQGGAFASIGLYAAGGLNLGGEPTDRVRAAEVTPGFFEALGVRTALGRAFTAMDVRQTPQVVVIGHRLWRRRFSGDSAIVGRSMILNGRSFVIIGVMPPRAEFPDAAELWIPSGAADHLGDGVPWPRIVGRLAPTVTPAQAQDQLVRIMSAYTGGRHPQYWSTVRATPIRAALVGDVVPVLVLVAAAALLVLVVACTNAASLLLARVAAREREFAVRRALGASRGQLVRQVFCESLLLSLAAGTIAVPGAFQTLRVARVYLPPTLHGAAEIGLDGRAFAALAALSLLTAILFGLAPAVSIPGRPSADVLRGASGASVDRFWRRFRSGLIVGEITIALVLLSGAVTIVQKVRELLAADLGARGTDALAIDAMLPLATYGSQESVRQFYERFEAELRAVPGIEEVGVTNELPGNAAELGEALRIGIAERPEDIGQGNRYASRLCASPGYFATVGIDLLAGRRFEAFDRPGSSKVAIVSAGYARALGLGPTEILGRHATVGGMMEAASWAEVVGVVRDVRAFGPESPFAAGIYQPFADAPPLSNSLHVVVRSKTDRQRLVPAIRAAAARLDGNLPLYNIRTFDEIRGVFLAERRFAMVLMLIFGGLAFGLAVLGLYGVINYLVQLRTREIGVRIAIGATPAVVRGEVLASGVLHVGVGIAIGFLATFASWRLVSAYVPRLGRLDPINLVVLAMAIIVVSVAATWVPAWRATRVDPVRALRCE